MVIVMYECVIRRREQYHTLCVNRECISQSLLFKEKTYSILRVVRRILYSIIAELYLSEKQSTYSMQKFIRAKKEQEDIREFLLSSTVVFYLHSICICSTAILKGMHI